MEYVWARFEKNALECNYQNYIAEALRVITENTAKFADGSYIKMRYADIINPPKPETRTAKEVIDSVKASLREISND